MKRLPLTDRLMISIAEAAAYSGFSRKKIENLLDTGKLQTFYATDNKVWRRVYRPQLENIVPTVK